MLYPKDALTIFLAPTVYVGTISLRMAQKLSVSSASLVVSSSSSPGPDVAQSLARQRQLRHQRSKSLEEGPLHSSINAQIISSSAPALWPPAGASGRSVHRCYPYFPVEILVRTKRRSIFGHEYPYMLSNAMHRHRHHHRMAPGARAGLLIDDLCCPGLIPSLSRQLSLCPDSSAAV